MNDTVRRLEERDAAGRQARGNAEAEGDAPLGQDRLKEEFESLDDRE